MSKLSAWWNDYGDIVKFFSALVGISCVMAGAFALVVLAPAYFIIEGFAWLLS